MFCIGMFNGFLGCDDTDHSIISTAFWQCTINMMIVYMHSVLSNDLNRSVIKLSERMELG